MQNYFKKGGKFSFSKNLKKKKKERVEKSFTEFGSIRNKECNYISSIVFLEINPHLRKAVQKRVVAAFHTCSNSHIVQPKQQHAKKESRRAPCIVS